MSDLAKWEKDNLCGICPYRKSVQAANERLTKEIREIREAVELHRWARYGYPAKRPFFSADRDLYRKAGIE